MVAVAVLAGVIAVSASAPLPAVSPIGLTKAGQQYAATQPADNSRCFVCHKNYQKERLVVGHTKAGVGCEKCHGPNDAHCMDEEHLTPPDIMYPRPKIVPACGACHDLNFARQKHVWWGHRIDTTGPKQVCTDCHGFHRLERRTSMWDKETREIIPVIPEIDNAKPTPATSPAKPVAK